MDCNDLQPCRSAFVPFYGKQVSITNSGGTVVIANDTAGHRSPSRRRTRTSREVVSADATP